MSGRGYNLHGTRIGIVASGEGERAAAGIHSRLAGLPHDGGPPHDVTFEIEIGDGRGLGRPRAARPVYDPPAGEVVYDDASDLVYLACGPRLRAVCAPRDGWIRAAAAGLEAEDLWTLSHPLFTLPLVETLKRRGLYGLHAGGVAAGGRGLLLPGTSGAGKSTLTLALVRAGFQFLGDDTLFLARRAGGAPQVLAFPDELDLSADSAAFFPELGPLPVGPRKSQLRVEKACGAQVAWECEPALLVFPRVAGTPASRLTPLERGEALLELVPNVLLTEPRSSQAHLDALAELVAASDCYRLETGTDLEEAVRLLQALVSPGPGGGTP